MSHKVHAGEYDSFFRLGNNYGRKFAEKIVTHGKRGILKELTKNYVPSEEFCTDALGEFSNYHKIPFEKQQKARAWFLEGWTKALMAAHESYRKSVSTLDLDDLEEDTKKELRFMKVSDGQFAFSMIDLSMMLAEAGEKHMLVLAAKPDALAELLSLNSSEADDECGESDSEFGNYVMFLFKRGKFAKFLERNKGDLKSRSLEKAVEELVAKLNKTVDTNGEFIAIVREQDDNATVTAEYYETSKGKQVWKKIKDAWDDIEAEDDDEEFDSDIDEVEED